MIGFLSGTILAINPTYCLLLTGGVGYEVYLPTRTLQKLIVNQESNFYIYTHVREDQLKLFGFESSLEKDLFKAMLDVSGIGPKSALGILSAGTVGDIQKAIIEANLSFFTKIKGLGKKNAQKLIIELKGKLGSINELDLTESGDRYSEDVITALQNFGFLKKDIILVLEKLDNTLTEEELIKMALKQLGKN